jgi:hypothetical protein
MPHTAPTTQPPPRMAPTSTTPAAPPTALASQPYPLYYSHRLWAVQDPPALPLHQLSLPMKVVPVAPLVNPHPMMTWVKQGFRLSTDRLTLSATSASTLMPVPSSELALRHGRRVCCLDRQQHMGPCSSSCWLQRHHRQMDFQAQVQLRRLFGTVQARWVLRDFTQQPVVDYDENFSPVVKPAMVRTMHSLPISRSSPVQ